jgi:predicted NBD/HSP70 family sugar kinase
LSSDLINSFALAFVARWGPNSFRAQYFCALKPEFMRLKSGKNSREMKLLNGQRVLRLVRRAPIARSELAAETGLTRAALSGIIRGFMNEGVLIETGKRTRSAGRSPVLLELRPEYAFAIGLALSRTEVVVGIVDLTGQVIKSFPVDVADASKNVALRLMKQGLKRALTTIRSRRGRYLGLGICSPGPVDINTGAILNPPNFDLWHGIHFAQEFGTICGPNIFVENNASALTIAEKAYGKGRDCESFLLLVVDSGVGAGFFRGDEIYRGWRGFGSEVGHTSIDLDGPVCDCGLAGCVELYASVPALMRRAKAQQPQIKSWHDLVDRAYEGDKLSRSLIQEQARALGTSLVNILNVLELESIILTGDVLYRGELLRSVIEQFINQTAINRRLHRIPVHLASYDQQAGLKAAGAVVAERFFHGEIHPTMPFPLLKRKRISHKDN